MKTARKAILLVLCAILLVVSAVMGTLAYLTDTEDVTNTFTVGNIQIKLDESDESTPDTTDRTEEGNQYEDIQPGQTYVKDPTVTVLANSEDCYVRMLVTVTYNENADEVLAKYNYTTWFDFDDSWTEGTLVKTEKNATAKTIARTYEFRHKTTVADSISDTKLDALFTKITVPGEITNTELATLEGLTINVVAQAMQSAGFATPDLAWAEFPTT